MSQTTPLHKCYDVKLLVKYYIRLKSTFARTNSTWNNILTRLDIINNLDNYYANLVFSEWGIVNLICMATTITKYLTSFTVQTKGYIRLLFTYAYKKLKRKGQSMLCINCCYDCKRKQTQILVERKTNKTVMKLMPF